MKIRMEMILIGNGRQYAIRPGILSLEDGKVVNENRDSVTLLGLGDAELAVHIVLVNMVDCMDQQQRLAEEDYQGQCKVAATQNRIHGLHINYGAWGIGIRFLV